MNIGKTPTIGRLTYWKGQEVVTIAGAFRLIETDTDPVVYYSAPHRRTMNPLTYAMNVIEFEEVAS